MTNTVHFTSGDANPLNDSNNRRWQVVEVAVKRIPQRTERREIVPSCEVRPDGKVVSGLSTAVRPTGTLRELTPKELADLRSGIEKRSPTGRMLPDPRERLRAMMTPLRTPVFQHVGTSHHSVEGDFSGLERRVFASPTFAAPYLAGKNSHAFVIDEALMPAPTDARHFQHALAELISEGYLANYGIYQDSAWWVQREQDRTCLVCGAAESQCCGC